MENINGNIHPENYSQAKNFSQLFSLVKEKEAPESYREAYEEASFLAKNFVDNKNKGTWDAVEFEKNIRTKYPTLPDDFISALANAIQNYNSPVNHPEEPLW
jgi:hypothetical protein